MSNIYIQEPATDGKVLLKSSAGDFDIELWSREAPKACQNFIQLCLEGYYNGTVFHRVVPGFIAQGGDPTGTGEGGESVFGKPFRDEFHTRLRFVRRGLVAMANAGPNDNGSQFFFTLGPCPELQNKHTVFGKVTGDTLYNLPRFEEGIIGKDDKPEYPHKIIKAEVLKNPFPDITPRVKIENEIPKDERRRKKKKGTKNFKLLSFGDEAEEEEEEVLAATKSFSMRGNSAHDIAMDPTLSASTGKGKQANSEDVPDVKEEQEEEDNEEIENEISNNDVIMESKPEVELDDEKSAKMLEVQAEIKKLKRELTGKAPEEEPVKIEQTEVNTGESDTIREYKLNKAKYVDEKKKLPKKGTSREQQTLALLQRFSAKVVRTFDDNSDSDGEKGEKKDPDDTIEEEEDEDGDGDAWLKHRFHFEESIPVVAKDASTKDDNWYDMNDPRNPLNKRRRDDMPTKAKKPRN